jgi:radical SAM superfamily enzyme YgiQ (UPF0313 family)
MNIRRKGFRWLKLRPLVNVVPSPSLLYLVPHLKRDGHEVAYLEGLFSTDDEVLSALTRWKPDVVGMTITSVDWRNAKRLAPRIKEALPEVTLVAGGIHPTLWKEQCFDECPQLDVVVYGEGELTTRELACRLQDRASLQGLQGTVFRDNGNIVTNAPRPVVEDLDTFPFPDRSVVDLDSYLPSPTFYHRLPHASIIGSRGCPYRCTFCHTEHHTRMRSARNIVDEIEFLNRRHQVVDVAFWDDTFTLSENRAYEICDEMLRRDLDVEWCVNARADKVTRPLLERMKRAGCWRVLYGIESGVQKNLDTLKKDLTLEEIAKAVRLTNEVGIEAYGTFMFGIPGETYDDGLKTIEFACSVGLDFAVFVSLTPFPGCEVYDDVKAGRIKAVKHDPPYDLKNISFVPDGLTEQQIAHLIKMGHKRFYLRPKQVLRRAAKMRNLHDLKKNAKGFLLLLTSS